MQPKKHVNNQGSPTLTADPNLYEPLISIANFIQEAVVRDENIHDTCQQR